MFLIVSTSRAGRGRAERVAEGERRRDVDPDGASHGDHRHQDDPADVGHLAEERADARRREQLSEPDDEHVTSAMPPIPPISVAAMKRSWFVESRYQSRIRLSLRIALGCAERHEEARDEERAEPQAPRRRPISAEALLTGQNDRFGVRVRRAAR